MKENPIHTPEVRNTTTEKLLIPPSQKAEVLNRTKKELKELSNQPPLNQANATISSAEQKITLPHKKPNKLQEFFANILGFFHGVDIEKGVTIRDASDVKKVREAFRPLINLDDTSLEWRAGDFIIYDKESWIVKFFKADEKQESGHAIDPYGMVRANNGTKPLPQAPTDEEIETYIQLENNETKLSKALWDFIVKRGPARDAGANMCGRAVHYLLKRFGINFSSRDGKHYYSGLKKDKRFKEISVNSLDEIPPGAIVTYSGKGEINGKPHGSKANQDHGHVEIKGSNKMYYSFYAGVNPGGSAKAPQFHNNFEKWKQATGLQGVFVPVSKV